MHGKACARYVLIVDLTLLKFCMVNEKGRSFEFKTESGDNKNRNRKLTSSDEISEQTEMDIVLLLIVYRAMIQASIFLNKRNAFSKSQFPFRNSRFHSLLNALSLCNDMHERHLALKRSFLFI